ncbi:S9 family peptidase [Sphingobium ummariense]|uniref:S9 family peptidase n=1 Tax=Sphingobium ummariense TaxID=420994 RepID=UPI000A03454C|nr:alpha/beta fold hydrolase [Sphingobium ummariense]
MMIELTGRKRKQARSTASRPYRVILLASAMLTATSAAAQRDQSQADLDARVAHAQQFASAKLFAKVRNSGVTFRWIGKTDRFWFRKVLDNGEQGFIVVDAATGRQEQLFDPLAMNAALNTAGAQGVPRIVSIAVPGDGRSILVNVAKPGAECRWPQGVGGCDVPTQTYRCDLPVTSCGATPIPGADLVFSPDRKRALFIRDHNLWLREVDSGAERQLTTGGVEGFAYGGQDLQTDFTRVVRRRSGLPEPLNGAFWSPDGRYVLAARHDLRNIPERHLVTEYLPPEGGRPIIHTGRLPLASDERYPDATLDIIDMAAGTVTPAAIDPQTLADGAVVSIYLTGTVWWSGTEVWYLGTKRGGREARLSRITLADGKVTDVITETSQAFIPTNANSFNGANINVLSSGREAIWYSERDGWGHLYLYDGRTGRVKRHLTRGAWVVTDLIGVDETTRTAYFAAAGREAGRNPYYRHLYSVSLDGGEPRLLTPDNADHDFINPIAPIVASSGSISPSGRYIIDSFSTSAQPDKVVLRRIDGTAIADVLSADITALAATGWRPPEQFVVKAADGKTDLYGLMVKPINFDPAKKYPIIDITYPNPGSKFTPTTFRDVFLNSTMLNAHAFAEAGAIVVGFDARGMGFRSKAFRETFDETDDPMGAADHVAAIRNMAATRPYLDLGRVGTTGHSFGGFGSLRATLLYPDFFKVVVSGESTGNLFDSSMDFNTERKFGIPTDQRTKDYYQRLFSGSLAERLKGNLLLIGAGADENVPFQNLMQLIAAFNRAGKVYDTLIMPDSTHFGGREPYGVMRTIRYFAEHLGGPE